MSIPTSTFASVQRPERSERPQSVSFDYSKVLLPPREGRIQVVSVETVIDQRYGKPRYNYRKVRLNTVWIVPGWEKAIRGTKEEQDAFRMKGHGKFFTLEYNPVCSAPGVNARGEATQESGLYTLFRIAFNDGEPLTDQQMGRDLNDEQLAEWAALYNRAMAGEEGALKRYAELYPYASVPRLKKDEFDEEGESPISGIEDARVRYAAFRVAEMLNAIAYKKMQFFAIPETKLRVKDDPKGRYKKGDKYNRIASITAVVPDDERLPDYEPYPRPRDPREDADDPDITCDECGERLRGYARSVDGKWVTNTQAAEESEERYGKVLCGRCIKQRKRADAGEYAPF